MTSRTTVRSGQAREVGQGKSGRCCANRRLAPLHCHREPFDKIVSRLCVSAAYPPQMASFSRPRLQSPCHAPWSATCPDSGGHRSRGCGGTSFAGHPGSTVGDRAPIVLDRAVVTNLRNLWQPRNAYGINELYCIERARRCYRCLDGYCHSRGCKLHSPSRSQTSGHLTPSTLVHSSERRRDAGGRTTSRTDKPENFRE